MMGLSGIRALRWNKLNNLYQKTPRGLGASSPQTITKAFYNPCVVHNLDLLSHHVIFEKNLFSIMSAFEALLSPTIDSVLGKRGGSHGYSYSEIIRSLMCVYFCGGSCTEDVT